MAATSPSSALLSPSHWEGSENPFLHPHMHSDDTLKPARRARTQTLPTDPGPSDISRGSVVADFGARQRPALRPKRSKDLLSSSSGLSKRMSFMELSDPSPAQGLLGTLKGRLNKKRSAPLLGSLSVPAPQAPPCPPPLTFRSSSDAPIPSFMPKDSYFKLSPRPSQSFRDQRKRTAIPEEILDGIGRGVKNVPDNESLTEDEYSDLGEEVDISTGKYRAFPLRRRNGSLLHSYSHLDAPYVQSYDTVDLQSDVYFHQLLRRLNASDSPTFHDYRVPPRNVLDLGCGEGTWVKDAAMAWADAGTTVTGFDLVDLVNADASLPPNATWTRGNFVAYRLPFKSNSFNLVRLSNLSSAIPESRWEHVLMEIRRVLKPHGRLEVIDDELIFPYPEHGIDKPSGAARFKQSSRPQRSSYESSASKESDNTLVSSNSGEIDSSFLMMDDDENAESVPALSDGESEDESDCRPETVHETSTLAESEIATIGDDEESASTVLSQAIEKVYETMLENVYQVNPRPAEFLEDLMWKVFGSNGRTRQIRDFKLSLLDRDMHDLVLESKYHMHLASLQENSKRSHKLHKSEKEQKRLDKDKAFIDKLVLTNSGGKALKLLGANGSTPAFDPISTQLSDVSDITIESLGTRPRRNRASSFFASHTSSPRPSSSSSLSSHASFSPRKKRHTPSGLFLYPDQFLETTPSELERYLFKHTDSVLSSKDALDMHVLRLADKDTGKAAVSEKEWADMLWEYERYRRERFNLPDVGGQLDEWETWEDFNDWDAFLRESPKQPMKLMPQVASAIANEKQHGSTQVRHIRVFESYKVGK